MRFPRPERRAADRAASSLAKRVGRRIASLREERGVSIRGLADLAGVSPTTVQRVEAGSEDASLLTLNRLAFALDVSVESLLAP